MKRILFAAFILCASIACKKQGAPAPKEKLLSSIYEDNKLRYSYEYRSDKKLKKVKKYADGAVDPVMEDTYEYDAAGNLKEKNRINFSIPSKFLYECNADGLVTKISVIDMSGADSGEVSQWSSYSYNARKQLVKINYYLGDDKPEGYETLEYYDEGGLAKIKAYVEGAGGSTLFVYWKYTGSSIRLSPGLMRAFIEPDKKEFMFMNAKSIDIELYAAGVVSSSTNHTMSDREAAAAGALGKQTITTKKTFPGIGPSTVKKMRYEYVEM